MLNRSPIPALKNFGERADFPSFFDRSNHLSLNSYIIIFGPPRNLLEIYITRIIELNVVLSVVDPLKYLLCIDAVTTLIEIWLRENLIFFS